MSGMDLYVIWIEYFLGCSPQAMPLQTATLSKWKHLREDFLSGVCSLCCDFLSFCALVPRVLCQGY